MCTRVISELGTDYSPSYVVFDYTGNSSLEELRDLAFTWNPGDLILAEPLFLKELMSRSDCEGIIWLSARVIDFPEHLFAWIVAHEARHLYQFKKNLDCRANRNLVGSLRRRPEFVTMPPTLFGLSELDAEVSALKALRSLYGVEAADEFLTQTSLPRGPFPIYNRFLKEAEAQWIESQTDRGPE